MWLYVEYRVIGRGEICKKICPRVPHRKGNPTPPNGISPFRGALALKKLLAEEAAAGITYKLRAAGKDFLVAGEGYVALLARVFAFPGSGRSQR